MTCDLTRPHPICHGRRRQQQPEIPLLLRPGAYGNQDSPGPVSIFHPQPARTKNPSPHSPTIPEDTRLFIPVQAKCDGDIKLLVAMQTALESVGLESPIVTIARFIHSSPAFKTSMNFSLYPVLGPSRYFAIYQDWE